MADCGGWSRDVRSPESRFLWEPVLECLGTLSGPPGVVSAVLGGRAENRGPRPHSKTKKGDFSWRGTGMARGLEVLAPSFNSGVRDEEQTDRKLVNLRAVRWTVWD